MLFYVWISDIQMTAIVNNGAHQTMLFPNLKRAYYFTCRKIYLSYKCEADVKISVVSATFFKYII